VSTFEHVVDVILSRALPLLIGSSIGVLAIHTIYESLRHLIRGVCATGKVVGYERVEGCYCPVVEFTARDGSQRRFISGSGRGTRQFREGARVGVIYDPARPDRVVLRTFLSLWLFPVVLTGFAAAFLCVGLGIFRHAK
jgi:hypothetical protein